MQKLISLLVMIVCCGLLCGAAPKRKPATTQAGWWDELNAPPDPKAAPSPKWIWGPDKAKDGEERYFRITFDANLPTMHKTEDPHSAWLWAAGDNEITVYVNG